MRDKPYCELVQPHRFKYKGCDVSIHYSTKLGAYKASVLLPDNTSFEIPIGLNYPEAVAKKLRNKISEFL